MPKFKNNTQVKITDGPHKGKSGIVLTTGGKTCTVKTSEGSYNIAEKDLTTK
jgi:ribosomal protein L24